MTHNSQTWKRNMIQILKYINYKKECASICQNIIIILCHSKKHKVWKFKTWHIIKVKNINTCFFTYYLFIYFSTII